jgi:tetratricopeptide (TPR) repeat protein
LPLKLKRQIRSAELEVRPAPALLGAVREERRRLGVEAVLWRGIRRGNEDRRVDRVRAGFRTWPALLLLLLLVGACSKGTTDSDQASLALAAGIKAHEAGRLDEAAADYRKVLVYDPRNKFAYYNLGVIEQTQGDGGSAESDYRIALTIDPNFVPALFNLAILRTSSGGDREAIDLYKQVIQTDEGYAAAHLNLGFLLIDNGQEREGNAELANAVGLDPTLADRIPGDLQTSPVPQPSHSVGPQASGSASP